MTHKILVVEDDEKIARVLELQLKHSGYDVVRVKDGNHAESEFQTNHYDLLILDVMLPGMNGFEICRRIRDKSSVPIIILTAKSDVSDKIIGLDFGANDYLTKPFEMEELLARIRVQLRNDILKDSRNVIKKDDLEVNLDTYQVKRQGQEISLSKQEFELLVFLLENQGIVLKRERLLKKVWGYEFNGNGNILDVYIKYVRDKLDKPFGKKTIETVRGVGYVIR